MSLDHPILTTPSEDLPVSPELKFALIKAEFKNLSEALIYDADTLRTQMDFNYHNLTELIQFLESLGINRLLKD